MKKKTHYLFMFCIVGSIFVSCSNDVELKIEDQDSTYKTTYEKLKKEPSVSLLSTVNDSRSVTIDKGYPELSHQDLMYLSSLSQEDFIKLRDNLLEKLGDYGITDQDSLQDERYMQIFELLGGHEGIDKLMSFTENYMCSSEGWEQIERFLPDNLTTKQGKVYIYMATYVDRIGRPVYSFLSSIDSPLSRADDLLCRQQLKQKLSELGVEMTADAFIDMMTGGLATEDEMFIIGLDLTGVWLDYERCMGRWY